MISIALEFKINVLMPMYFGLIYCKPGLTEDLSSSLYFGALMVLHLVMEILEISGVLVNLYTLVLL